MRQRLVLPLALALLAGCPKPVREVSSLGINPSSIELFRGDEVQLVATAAWDDGTVREVTGEVAWSIDDRYVAEFTETPGVLRGLHDGSTVVRARLGTRETRRTVTVAGVRLSGLEVDPPHPVIPLSLRQKLEVIGLQGDGTKLDLSNEATWSSPSPSIATVENGQLIARGVGTTTLQVSARGRVQLVPVDVTPSAIRHLDAQPAVFTLPSGFTQRLLVTALLDDGTSFDVSTQVSWSSSSSTIAPFSQLPGEENLVIARQPGRATLTATLAGKRDTLALTVTDATLASLELTPPLATLFAGTTARFDVIGVFSDGTSASLTTQATWTSSAPGVFTVVDGLVQAFTAGRATLSVSVGGRTVSRELTVSNAPLLSLELSAPTFSVPRGLTTDARVFGLYADGARMELTSLATWSVQNVALAHVSNGSASGRVTGLSEGATSLTASVQGQSVSAPLTVTSAQLVDLQLTPPSAQLPVGTRVQLTATGVFSDGTSSDLTAQATWSSSDPTRVSISTQGASRGEAVALTQGSATLTAFVNGTSATATFTVTEAALARLELDPSPAVFPLGSTQPFTARGIFTDGASVDLTAQATWAVDDVTVATISNAPGTRGHLTAESQGQTLVSATLGSTTGSAPLTVTTAAPQRLELSPPSLTLPLGVEEPLRALVTFTDGATFDQTSQCTFTSSASAIASVSGARVTGRALGQARITARCSGLTAEADVTVTAATLASLTLSQPSVNLALGTRLVLRAEGTFSDGSTSDLTTQVTWSSSDNAIASISNASGTEGEVVALAIGTSTLRAQLGTRAATLTATVTAATLSSLELSPPQPSVPLGATLAFTLTGRFSDGSAQDLTSQATFTSTSPSVASISNASGSVGRLTALTRGTTAIEATFGALGTATTVTVSDAVLSRVELTPQPLSLAKLTRTRLTATGVWTDGATQNLTASCTWQSQSPTLAQVSNAPGQKGRVDALAPGVVTLTAGCNGVTGTATVTVTNATLTSISLSPAMPTAAAGFTAQLQATGVFSDGSSQPFTDFVSWSSADSSLAAVSNAVGTEGLVSARAQGTVAISATALGVTQPISFVVTAALLQSLELTPFSASVPKGLTFDFSALGHFSDGSVTPVSASCVWSSSSVGAPVSNASGTRGHVSALQEGSATITATLQGLVASASVIVTEATLTALTVTPFAPSFPRGVAQNLTATGTFSDGTTRDLTTGVTWSSDDVNLVTVSNAGGTQGLARGVGVGTTTVRATSGSLSGNTSITITPAQLVSLQVSPPLSIPRGLTGQINVTGVYTDQSTQDLTEQSTFTSSSGTVASISNVAGSRGRVTALNEGPTTITSTHAGLNATVTVTVTTAVLQSLALTPPNASVAAGLSLPLVATGTFSDGSTSDLTANANWSSDAPSTASVTGGVVTGHAVGTTTLRATVGGISGATGFTVSSALLQQLQVTPANASRAKGVPQQFTATGLFTDGSTQDLTTSVTWASSASGTVSVSNASGSKGLASTLGLGTVSISATLGLVSGSTPFTVTAAQPTSLTLSPGGGTAPLGSSRQYAAIAHFTDATTQNVTTSATWASSVTSVATISNVSGSKGLATTLATGATSISASWSGFGANATLVVIQTTLTRIDLTPTTGATALGYTRQFIATGTYSDGTTQLITDVATWTSSDDSVALVSNASGTRGLLSTVSVGSVTVSATWNGVTGSTSHAVTPAVLVFLTIDQPSLTLSVGSSGPLTCTGIFSDGSTQPLTTAVTWTSSDLAVAQVSNASGSEGQVSAIASGSAIVTATQGSVSASLSVTVN